MNELLLRWFVLMVDVSVKVLLLAGVAGLLLAGLRIRNSSIKHAAWLGVLVALVAMPLLSLLIPRIAIPLPIRSEFLAHVATKTNLLATVQPIVRPVTPVASVEMGISGPGEPVRNPSQPQMAAAPLQIEARPTKIELKTDASAARQNEDLINGDANSARSNNAVRLGEFLPACAVVWLMGCLMLLVRLVLSIRITRRLVERSIEIPDMEMIRPMAATILGSNRTRVCIRESSVTFVPLTIGWRYPAILLPTDWKSWSQEKLGHVLVHEVTHIRRGDCWTALYTEFVTSIYWFHPLTWWLKRRLSVLAEECCDDASIQISGTRAAYARHLLEIGSVLRCRPNRLNYAGLAMAHRSQVERRIVAILDPNRPLSQRLTWTATLLVAVFIISLVSVAASLKPTADTPTIAADRGEVIKVPAIDDQIAAARVDVATAEAEVSVDKQDMCRLNGRVIDSNGRPIAGATVSIRKIQRSPLVCGTNSSKLLGEVTTDANGQFEHSIPASQLPLVPENRLAATAEWIQVTAISLGQGIQIRDINRGRPDEPLKLKLVPETVIHGHVLTLEGRPVAGADVRVMEVTAAEGPKIDAWYAEVVKNDRSDLDELQMMTRQRPTNPQEPDRSAQATFRDGLSTSPEVFSAAKTDADGRFVISGIGKDHLALLQISGKGLVRTLINVVTRPMKPVKDFSGGSQLSTGVRTFYGSDCDVVVSPGIVVRGIVRDIETKKPLVGVTVTTDLLAGSIMSRTGFITTITDIEGRYQLEGLPPSKGNWLHVLQGNEPYLNTGFLPVAESVNLQPVTFDIELRKAVWVTGRAYDRTTNKPVRVKLGYSPFVTNPFTGAYWQYSDQIFNVAENVGDYRSDKNGRFRIPVIPGRGLLAAKCEEGGYIAGFGNDQVPEFRALATEGKSIEHQQLTSDSLGPFWFHSVRDIEPTADDSEIEVDLPLDPGASAKLIIVDAEQNPISRTFARGVNYPALRLSTETSQTVLSGLVTGKPVILWFRQQGWKQGEKPLEKIQVISADGNTESSTVIRMELTAHVIGRLIDPDAKPLNANHINLWFESESGESHHVIQRGSTSDDGNFEVEIPVGGKYRLTGDPNGRFAILAEHLEPKAGEEIDLGDVVATGEKLAGNANVENGR